MKLQTRKVNLSVGACLDNFADDLLGQLEHLFVELGLNLQMPLCPAKRQQSRELETETNVLKMSERALLMDELVATGRYIVCLSDLASVKELSSLVLDRDTGSVHEAAAIPIEFF